MTVFPGNSRGPNVGLTSPDSAGQSQSVSQPVACSPIILLAATGFGGWRTNLESTMAAAAQPQNGLGGGGGGGKLQMADKKPARRVGAKPPPDRAQKSMGCLSLKNPLRSGVGLSLTNKYLI